MRGPLDQPILRVLYQSGKVLAPKGLCAEVALALDVAHRCKENGNELVVVHRDVSPQNILISFEGEVRLTDFGIARAMNAASQTEPSQIRGKPAYMSPEQVRGREVDPRSDVFALGTILWELCTGRRLFMRDSQLATLMAVVGPEPEIEPPSKWNKSVPPELDRLVLEALDRDKVRRTGSAKSFAEKLQAIIWKMAKGPEEFDLRHLMSQRWPGEATGGVKAGGQPPATQPPPFALASLGPSAASSFPSISLAQREAPELNAWDGARRDFEVRSAGTDSSHDCGVNVPPLQKRQTWRRTLPAVGSLAAIGGALALLFSHSVARKSSQPLVRREDPPRASPLGANSSQAAPATGPRALEKREEDASGAARLQETEKREDPRAGPLGANSSQGAPVTRPQVPVKASRKQSDKPPPAPVPTGKGILSVTTIGGWADVYVDGQHQGNTPLILTLSAGRHGIRVDKEGYLAEERHIEVSEGDSSHLLLQLKPSKNEKPLGTSP